MEKWEGKKNKKSNWSNKKEMTPPKKKYHVQNNQQSDSYKKEVKKKKVCDRWWPSTLNQAEVLRGKVRQRWRKRVRNTWSHLLSGMLFSQAGMVVLSALLLHSLNCLCPVKNTHKKPREWFCQQDYLHAQKVTENYFLPPLRDFCTCIQKKTINRSALCLALWDKNRIRFLGGLTHPIGSLCGEYDFLSRKKKKSCQFYSV